MLFKFNECKSRVKYLCLNCSVLLTAGFLSVNKNLFLCILVLNSGIFFFTSSGLEIRLGIRGEKDGKSNFINNINLQRFGGPCFILAIHVTIQAKIPCPSSTPSYFPGLVIFVNSLKFELESLKTFPIFLFPLMFSFKLILCNR